MSPDAPAVLDACVLVPRLLCDLLLRLAEPPCLYLPRWSEDILGEVYRNQIRLGLPEVRARSWRTAVTQAFPEATVENYEPLIAACRNDPKDRHVLATAIKAEASTIVTFNLRDFSRDALEPWKVVAIHPSTFLLDFYDRVPDVVAQKLTEMARQDRVLSEVLEKLHRVVPTFATRVARDLDVSFD